MIQFNIQPNCLIMVNVPFAHLLQELQLYFTLYIVKSFSSNIHFYILMSA